MTGSQGTDGALITPIASIQKIPHRDEVYEFLKTRGPADLYVDVGAAFGDISGKIVGNTRELIAYEPFPNNVRLFRKKLAGHDNVRLVAKAVSNKIGRTTLFVDSTVQRGDPGWAESVGFSSIGRIETGARNILRSYRHIAWDAIRRRRGATTVRVRTTTLDADLAGRTVDFLKVDVQGAEPQVLEGARSLLDEQRIRLLYLEWTGNSYVIHRLAAAGYSIFDSVYIGFDAGSPDAGRSAFESNDFEVISTTPLSSGGNALEMIYHGAAADIERKLQHLNSGSRFIQTDLIALPEAEAGEFISFVRSR